MPHALLTEPEFRRRSAAALNWLQRSIDVHEGKGSAATLFFGKWAPAYPETTGYLIETLLDYGHFLGECKWLEYARGCGDWLLEVQHTDGSFPALYAHSGKPSVFNTGMILFGLSRLCREEESQRFVPALQKATAWLLSELAPEGSWPAHGYVEGFIPSYYTRAVWGLLEANKVLMNPEVEEAMRKALGFYAPRIKENGLVEHWGFHPGKPAFTHTIAYTWRGFWESALLLGEKDILPKVQHGLDTLAALRDSRGQLPGRLDVQGKPDHSFSCLTGNAQLSLLAGRIYQHSGEKRYEQMAFDFFEQTARRQVLRERSLYFGGIAGSSPLWGGYQRLRFPNWAVKFFLDAYLMLWKNRK
ncbi:MAG: hypothetical protein IPH04_00640 [Saprospirales bacterium]|nr:hypothetical protein [Saprospirales bacterium]